MKKNILVFPCGSEIGLEVYRSVKNSAHFNLIGASSVDDHGIFVYEQYIGNVPFINDKGCIKALAKIVKENNIDAIYPAMDLIVEVLKRQEKELGCMVIASCAETSSLCLSKRNSYKKLEAVIPVPKLFNPTDNVEFPVFVKPDMGYGSRDSKKINSKEELNCFLQNKIDMLVCEYLPGNEYTVDCFTDQNRKLLFAGARTRSRVMNGISVNTKPVKDDSLFVELAQKINSVIDFRGAWFFQVKKNSDGRLVLLELASRLGGSSGLFRACGINFALLSLYDAFGLPVAILANNYDIEMDRALDSRYKLELDYNEVFIDYDDCIYSRHSGFNCDVLKFIFQCKNKNIKITLVSKHIGNLRQELQEHGIEKLFDRIFHLENSEKKSAYIDNCKGIFIDDSFAERKEVKENANIAVFGLDMLPALY